MERASQERTTTESDGNSSRRESTVTTMSMTSERRTSYQSTQSARPTIGSNSNINSNSNSNWQESSTNQSGGSQSFLQDRTPVRGMQDIIGRMRAGDVGKKT